MAVEVVADAEGFVSSLASLQSTEFTDATLFADVAPLEAFYGRSGKRLLDIVLSALALAILSIPMVFIALTLRLSMGRGVLYRQARVGLNGENFIVLKFRTMQQDRRARAVGVLHDGLPDRRLRHKTETDPRHTRVGRLLRASSLDELPQLLNVLRGEMSMVGPRPELVHLVERMTPEMLERHSVRPGITGPWQVGARHLELHEAVSMDLDYIDALSFRNDIALIVKTPIALFRRTGS